MAVDLPQAVLERMATFVRAGKFQEAEAVGMDPDNPISFSIPKNRLQLGPIISEGAQAVVREAHLSEHVKVAVNIPISNLKFQQYLIKTIVGQQISTKAAASIWKKVQEGLKQIKNFKDKNLHQVLRSCGLSERKALYAQGVLENSQVARASRRQLKSLDSKTYASMLLDLRGVGPWTVEMSRIFYLGDEDVLSEGDYGIQVAHKKMFMNEKLSQDFYNNYAPYRTYVSLYLWRSLDF